MLRQTAKRNVLAEEVSAGRNVHPGCRNASYERYNLDKRDAVVNEFLGVDRALEVLSAEFPNYIGVDAERRAAIADRVSYLETDAYVAKVNEVRRREYDISLQYANELGYEDSPVIAPQTFTAGQPPYPPLGIFSDGRAYIWADYHLHLPGSVSRRAVPSHVVELHEILHGFQAVPCPFATILSEAVTDYLTTKAIEKSSLLSSTAGVGYGEQTRIVELLTRKFDAYDELKTAYFAGDVEPLRKKFDNERGAGSFEHWQNLFYVGYQDRGYQSDCRTVIMQPEWALMTSRGIPGVRLGQADVGDALHNRMFETEISPHILGERFGATGDE